MANMGSIPETTGDDPPWEEADRLLRGLSDLRRRLSELEEELQQTMAEARRRQEVQAEPLNREMARLEQSLAALALSRKAEMFTGRRSVALTHGGLGFRRAREVEPVRQGWNEVAARLHGLGLSEGLRMRVEVNRGALRRWTEDRLAQVGVRRVERDRFWYELKAYPIPLDEKEAAE
ncbi:MAG: host-nuclease inhibitor Gam family protein [Magnetococcales bacterium]|nr:host-nuclease inhibitor Gam family protein [Magnetococcales bacterium]